MRGRETAYRALLRARLRGRHFTIISNNCWGAHIYHELGIAYETPFVGLFFDPNCYLNLLTRFRSVISNPLTFVDYSQRPAVNKFREGCGSAYPIGRLEEDIEIQFLHSDSEAEAAQKWNRRVARINQDDDKLFVKFCDHDRPTQTHLEVFDQLPFPHKICFTGKQYPEFKSTIYIPGCANEFVPDGGALQRVSRRNFDVAGWIGGGSGKPKWHDLGCRFWPR